ncbi:hypothetical protein GWI33_011419 [Rhynchophorus ferrugineus]|uniref:Uncharacterized protein n=1 Tax=Rhynchophorus ferrugineus TaxID=354439 RepID=A0A834IS74_RHYFE|nr:hypothetical protein GWI33_011419 [Rhynchophorus ferrugineus]
MPPTLIDSLIGYCYSSLTQLSIHRKEYRRDIRRRKHRDRTKKPDSNNTQISIPAAARIKNPFIPPGWQVNSTQLVGSQLAVAVGGSGGIDAGLMVEVEDGWSPSFTEWAIKIKGHFYRPLDIVPLMF